MIAAAISIHPGERLSINAHRSGGTRWVTIQSADADNSPEVVVFYDEPAEVEDLATRLIEAVGGQR